MLVIGDTLAQYNIFKKGKNYKVTCVPSLFGPVRLPCQEV